MIAFRKITALAGLAALIGSAHAHELATHASITFAAYKRSVLFSSELLEDLGIHSGDNPFGPIYYDVSGADARERASDAFEADKMPKGTEPLSIEGWLMRGAIREDDLGEILGIPKGDDPHDDPYGNIFRVKHHFYDPVFDRPLTRTGVNDAQRAPAWALGAQHPFSQPDAGDANRRNHFTVLDAREAMYRALTGRDSRGNVLAAGALSERNRYWATTFRALGDTLHLLQDMGQPQHTRNDLHAGVLGLGDESIYELYVDARASGAPSYTIDGVLVTPVPLIYDGYPIPAFSKYSDFFSTREGLNGRGLADYSNRGFFSAGTNLGSNDYAFPSNDARSYTTESATALLPGHPGVSTRFLRGDVPDFLSSAFNANIRMTTESAFYDFVPTVRPGPPSRVYWLNRFNYDDMAKLLIPRAVAYSAGLINYFFRGSKIDLVPDPANANRLLVRNLGREPMKGKFRLFYDDASDTRRPVLDANGNEIVWDTEVLLAGATPAGMLAPGANMAVDAFPPPANPAPKAAGDFMLVFSGDMGEEKADPASGTVGAVAAKRVRAPYNGVLYIAGRTAARQTVFFKVDKAGVSVLKPGEFNPVVFVAGQLFDHYERAYDFKQVEFTQATGGVLVHKTVGLLFQGGGSLVRNPVTGGMEARSGVVWIAKSPDPAVGSFEFTLSITDFLNGRQAQLVYIRRFVNPEGGPGLANGVLRLPDLPSNAGYAYSDFFKGVLMVNGDGTEIYPRGGASFRRYGIRISLAPFPSAALFDLPAASAPTFTSKPPSTNMISLGECSVDYIGSNGAPQTASAPHTRTEQILQDGTFVSGNFVTIEDFLNGKLLTYTAAGKTRTLQTNVLETCEAHALDWATGSSRVKVNLLRRQQFVHIERSENEWSFGEGSLRNVTDRFTVQPSQAGYSCGGPFDPGRVTWLFGNSFADLDYAYEGFGPCPLQSAHAYVFGDDPQNPKQSVNRALTDRAKDAIYFDVLRTDAGSFSVMKFRDEILIPGPGFVADASPIGEVFLAKPDLSLIVHEPKAGNMPVLTRELIPAGVVELVAALWM